VHTVSHFAHLRDHATFVNSDANNKRIDKLAWAIEHLRPGIVNYNIMIEMTREEVGDPIRTYHWVILVLSKNWMMQTFLQTNLGIRRMDAERQAGIKLVWPTWWGGVQGSQTTAEENRRTYR
jgi:hypothetical protein